jgi:hypothetical protein
MLNDMFAIQNDTSVEQKHELLNFWRKNADIKGIIIRI